MSAFTYQDVLLKAASRVEQEGMWCQGTMYVETSRGMAACAVGAVALAANELGVESGDALNVLNRHLGGGPRIVHWNDAPGRTAFEVAEAMRRAAE